MPSVTIIGAGPAGCVAATLLARAGIDVSLVEQHRFPRDKVCGECLSSLGIDVLRRTGLASALIASKPNKLTRGVLVSADGYESVLRLPAAMWGISRRVMDTALLNAARDNGATIHQPARCESISHNGHVTSRIRSLTSNALNEIESDWLLVADGKGAIGVERPQPSGDMGLKAHFEAVDDTPDAITLLGVNGHYVGVAAIEGGLWNVAMNIPAARLRASGGHFDKLFKELQLENVGLRNRFCNARRVSDWLTSPLPRFAVSSQWPDRVLPIGNAAAALEPIGGEGMGLAMRSAEIVAGEFIAADRENRDVRSSALRRQMSQLWSTRSLACRMGTKLLSSPTLSPLVTRLIQPFAPLALSLVGKAK